MADREHQAPAAELDLGLPPRPEPSRTICSQCAHKVHSEPCRKLGRMECRWVELGGGGSLVRGQWPCGCLHGVPPEILDLAQNREEERR